MIFHIFNCILQHSCTQHVALELFGHSLKPSEILQLFYLQQLHCQLAKKVAADKHMDVLKIGTFEWLEDLTSEVTKQMLTHCESAHQQHHLLEILARTMFGRNFSCSGMLKE